MIYMKPGTWQPCEVIVLLVLLLDEKNLFVFYLFIIRISPSHTVQLFVWQPV